MELVQPLMLAALAAVAVPIFVHLYNRRRAVKRRFPALEFLLRSNRRQARSIKLRQLLLLMLRVGVFMLLPLALAKPFLASEEGTSAEDRLPSATVYVLDDSVSMDAVVDGTSLYEQARASLIERLEAQGRNDRAALVYASTPEQTPYAELVEDAGLLVEEVEGHERSDLRGDLRRGLEVARDLLVASEQPVRRVVILTDLTASSWPEAISGDLVGGVARVEVVSLRGAGGAPVNVALTGVGHQPDPAGIAGSYEIWGEVVAYNTGAPVEAELTLTIDGEEVATTALTLPPGQPQRAVFTHRLEAGEQGTAALTVRADADALAADNTRRLVMRRSREVRALLVNGDPRSLPYQDELFYLERALRPGEESRSQIAPRVVSPEGLSAAALEETDVVVLANVRSLSPAQVSQLEGFVEEGGGLLITVGDQVEPQAINAQLARLLPKPLRSVKELARPGDPDAPIKVTRFDQADYTHPALSAFAMPGGEGLQRVMVYAYMLVEPEARSEATILATYADGAPALIERPVGAGRVMLLTTSVDRDWAELAIQKPFLPLMQRAIEHLARRTGLGEGGQAIAGEPTRLALEAPVERLTVSGPDEARLVLSRQEMEALEGPPVLTPPRVGFYAVSVTDQGAEVRTPQLDFAVNIDPRASRVEPIEVATLAPYWSTPPQDVQVGEGGPYGSAERRIELWPPLLLAALILLYLETLVGLRRSFLRRLGRLGRREEATDRGEAPA